MKANKNRSFSIALVALALLLATTATADNTLDSLFIQTIVQDNGDAVVREKRYYYIDDDESTEFYLPMELPEYMRMRGFLVTEDGHSMINDGSEWDIDRTREEKKGHFGYIEKDDNDYELCFGMGDNGEHVFELQYALTNMLCNYGDTAAIYFNFFARRNKEQPEKFELTIEREDGQPIDSCKMWAFGFANGEIHLVDGKVKVWNTGPIDYEEYVTLLVAFPPGEFHPGHVMDEDFPTVRDRAFEGAYTNDMGGNQFASSDDDDSNEPWFYVIIAAIVGGWYAIKMRLKRRKYIGKESELVWFRDQPLEGSLYKSQGVMKELYPIKNDTKDLLGAYIMRLINEGSLTVVDQMYKKDIKKMLKVHDPKTAGREQKDPTDSQNMKAIMTLLEAAAGENRILEPKELNTFASDFPTEMEDLYSNIQLKPSVSLKAIGKKGCQEVVGLKKFLKEFTLVKERHVVEVKLWNEYLVFATLFGIADQVKKDFKKICPEYFEMSDFGKTYDEISTNYLLVNSMAQTMASAFSSAYQTNHPSSSGGGGGSFSGGGGGASGGGCGGGSR